MDCSSKCTKDSDRILLNVLSTALQKQTRETVYIERDGDGFSALGGARRYCMPAKENQILDKRL